jgi:low affinity Fe/Cu permease
MRDRFNRFVDRITLALGSATALAASVIVVLVWAITGPLFHFSDTWQLVINTSTTVITFWMVFVIQNSANRDSKAIHLKLDEVIRSIEGARNTFITLEREPAAVIEETEAALADVAALDREDSTAPPRLSRRPSATSRQRTGRTIRPTKRRA